MILNKVSNTGLTLLKKELILLIGHLHRPIPMTALIVTMMELLLNTQMQMESTGGLVNMTTNGIGHQPHLMAI